MKSRTDNFPWITKLSAKQLPEKKGKRTIEWFKENHWWWNRVENAIDLWLNSAAGKKLWYREPNCDDKGDEQLLAKRLLKQKKVREDLRASLNKQWLTVRKSASYYEFRRRVLKEKSNLSWPKLSSKQRIEWHRKYCSIVDQVQVLTSIRGQLSKPELARHFSHHEEEPPLHTHLIVPDYENAFQRLEGTGWTDAHFLQIDLSRNDDTILKAFEKFLASTRIEYGVPKPPKNKRYKSTPNDPCIWEEHEIDLAVDGVTTKDGNPFFKASEEHDKSTWLSELEDFDSSWLSKSTRALRWSLQIVPPLNQ